MCSDTLMAGAAKTFGEDRAFLSRYTSIIQLTAQDNQASILVAPNWQGRVMTSTNGGKDGISYGWINYELARKGISPVDEREGLEKHIHVFGGEDRFWLGPEGGQNALFFPSTAKGYAFEDWKTPALLDTAAYEVQTHTDRSVTFTKAGDLVNRLGTKLNFEIRRTVAMLERDTWQPLVGVPGSDDVASVAFQSSNSLTNLGPVGWDRDAGLPSIWILGMFKPSDDIAMVMPLSKFPEQVQEQPLINTDYFGEVADDRLFVRENVAYFKGDGNYRAKIGIPPRCASAFLGSYHSGQETLTVVHFNLPDNAGTRPYVRSQWEHHDEPYAGDVVNGYNDGPPEPGAKPFGPFYELETSSLALELLPGENYTHVQTTMHFRGKRQHLDPIALKTLGVNIDDMTSAFAKTMHE